MGEGNKVLRSELAVSHSTHGDIYTVRQELNASGDLMNEMLSEFQTQLEDQMADHGEKMDKMRMEATQYVEQMRQSCELELAASESQLLLCLQGEARMEEELRDTRSECECLMRKTAAGHPELAPTLKFPSSLLPPPPTETHPVSAPYPPPSPSQLLLLACRSPSLSRDLAVRVLPMRPQLRAGPVPVLPVRVQSPSPPEFPQALETARAVSLSTTATVTMASRKGLTRRNHHLMATMILTTAVTMATTKKNGKKNHLNMVVKFSDPARRSRRGSPIN